MISTTRALLFFSQPIQAHKNSTTSHGNLFPDETHFTSIHDFFLKKFAWNLEPSFPNVHHGVVIGLDHTLITVHGTLELEQNQPKGAVIGHWAAGGAG